MAGEELRAGLPVLSFADAEAMEAWLERHGTSSTGFWLRLFKKGSGAACVSRDEAIDAALCFGWIDGQLDRCDSQSWLIRFTPRRPKSNWSQVNAARVAALEAAGRMRPAGLAEVEAAKADGRWSAAYAPQSRAEVPPDLQAALDANPAAAAFFATLKGANRYAILYRIGAAKKPETRARRIAGFVAMLERGGDGARVRARGQSRSANWTSSQRLPQSSFNTALSLPVMPDLIQHPLSFASLRGES